LADVLRDVLPKAHLIDLSTPTAESAAKKLPLHITPALNPTKHQTRYIVSGEPEPFNRIASLIMNGDCRAEKIFY
jgi:hypothetical protein